MGKINARKAMDYLKTSLAKVWGISVRDLDSKFDFSSDKYKGESVERLYAEHAIDEDGEFEVSISLSVYESGFTYFQVTYGEMDPTYSNQLLLNELNYETQLKTYIDEDDDLVSIWCFNAVDEKSFSHYFIDFMDMLDRILDQEVFQDEIFNKITPIED